MGRSVCKTEQIFGSHQVAKKSLLFKNWWNGKKNYFLKFNSPLPNCEYLNLKINIINSDIFSDYSSLAYPGLPTKDETDYLKLIKYDNIWRLKSRTKPRPKYIFNKCGTNIYFFTLQRFDPSPITITEF